MVLERQTTPKRSHRTYKYLYIPRYGLQSKGKKNACALERGSATVVRVMVKGAVGGLLTVYAGPPRDARKSLTRGPSLMAAEAVEAPSRAS
jgi:hypothetical protein